MKSKMLFISNVLATIYAIWLICNFGGKLIDIGEGMGQAYNLVGFNSKIVNSVFLIIGLLILHICSFTIGAVLGWQGFITKENKKAKRAAILYLVGTICFPLYIFYGLPITILGLIGNSKQKKLNALEN